MKELLKDQLDQCWKHLDKLMIFVAFVFAMCVAVFISVHSGMDEGTLDWARTITVSIFSVLAGLVGGIEMGKRMVPAVQPEPAPQPPAPQVMAANVDLAAPPAAEAPPKGDR